MSFAIAFPSILLKSGHTRVNFMATRCFLFNTKLNYVRLQKRKPFLIRNFFSEKNNWFLVLLMSSPRDMKLKTSIIYCRSLRRWYEYLLLIWLPLQKKNLLSRKLFVAIQSNFASKTFFQRREWHGNALN